MEPSGGISATKNGRNDANSRRRKENGEVLMLPERPPPPGLPFVAAFFAGEIVVRRFIYACSVKFNG